MRVVVASLRIQLFWYNEHRNIRFSRARLFAFSIRKAVNYRKCSILIIDKRTPVGNNSTNADR
jgi:hypothetical protein